MNNPYKKDVFFAAICLGSIAALVIYLLADDRLEPPTTFQPSSDMQQQIVSVAESVDAAFVKQWQQNGLKPAPEAEMLTIARRLSLGLAGTIPSLEEIRELEKQPSEQRLNWWVSRLLEDQRTHDYLAERFARALVGTEDGPFIIYRRRRFVSWLSEQFASDRPYDELVRELLTQDGLWTDTPAVNFYTRTIPPDEENAKPDPILLAGRTSRAFLGMRIDCLQCHDDFLGNVNLGSPDNPSGGTQVDFHSLAAFFQQTENTLLGIQDNRETDEYRIKLLGDGEASPISPSVPFHLELLNRDQSNLRQQLSNWVTHPQNRPFARALVNRVWATMFGRPLVEPVDDIPLAGPFPPALDILTDDFVSHGFRLHRLIRIIAQTQVFSLDSATESEVPSNQEAEWAMFPLIRLRPEQVSGGITQSTKLTTLNSTAHIFARLSQFGQQNSFIERFGDVGEDEFKDRGETVTQRLLLLNGDVISERLNNPLNVPAHLNAISEDNETAVEVIYLSTLTRKPNLEERMRFVNELDKRSGDERAERTVDIYWALINSAEFRWNH